jgi:hypothetical protein
MRSPNLKDEEIHTPANYYRFGDFEVEFHGRQWRQCVGACAAITLVIIECFVDFLDHPLQRGRVWRRSWRLRKAYSGNEANCEQAADIPCLHCPYSRAAFTDP